MDLANPTKIKEKGLKERFKSRQKDDDMRIILSTPSGRRIIWGYLEECGVFRSSFTGNSTTFFNEGKRQIGLVMIADVMAASPEMYLLMSKENDEEKFNKSKKEKK